MSTLLVRPTVLAAELGMAGREKVKPSEAPSKAQAAAVDEKERDRKLVDRVREGDQDAYRQLVERYQRRAHAIAIGIVGNHHDAEDLVQQAFLKAYKSLGSFRGQSSFYTWLYRIIFNLSIDLSRKAYRRSERGYEDSATIDSLAQQTDRDATTYLSQVDTPDQRLRRQEVRDRFKQALDKLSPEHRAVIVLREIEGLSYNEISDVVGCSKGTIMSRLHHARKRMQSMLADLMPNYTEDAEQENHLEE